MVHPDGHLGFSPADLGPMSGHFSARQNGYTPEIVLLLLSLAFPAGRLDAQTDVLSPVVGELEIVSALQSCSNTRWCFDQHKSGLHAPGMGICQADDTFAWDANLNTPIWDADAGRPVFAVAQGIVTDTFGGCTNAGGQYGQLLLQHESESGVWWSGHLHLKNIQVVRGQKVDNSTLLGYISNTSPQSIPNHIHFAIYRGENTKGGLRSIDANIIARSSELSHPSIEASGIVNAASYVSGPVAPGEIIAIFGSNIGPRELTNLHLNSEGLLDTTLAETRVFFDNIAAPLLYVSSGQLAATVPYAVAGKASTELRIEYKGLKSNVVTVPVSNAAPGVFSLDATGKGQGAILNQDYSVNSSERPAPQGSVVMIYGTGEGQTDPPGVDGKLAAAPLPRPRLPVSVKIGGIEAEVLYSGGAPGSVAGLLQVNARVPMDAPSGIVPVVLIVGNVSSQPGITMAVGRPDSTAVSYAISTVAGKGGAFCDGPDSTFCGDGGPATAAALWAPAGVTVDPSGNLYIGVSGRVRRVSPEGILSTVAGGGTTLGDGGPAVGARLEHPAGLLVDRSGNLFIADSADNRIRKVIPSGVISTFAGTGAQFAEFRGDGGPATLANLRGPKGVAVDSAGNLYIADGGYHRIRKVDPSGVITTVAGNGRAGFGGDGGPATAAELNEPSGVAVDFVGNLYIADTANNRVRIVTQEGVISTVAGNGVCQVFTSCFSGDGGPARMAQLNRPYGVAVDAAGNLYIADTNNFRIRKVRPDGTVHTIAGTDGYVYNGDGPDATAATLGFPQYLAVDAFGNVYVSDGWNNRVRKLIPR